MNKKAECYLWIKSDAAKELISTKVAFEKAIGNLRNSNPLSDFERGLDIGLAKSLEMGARRIKRSLLILLEEV
jgi:hypothetical protein